MLFPRTSRPVGVRVRCHGGGVGLPCRVLCTNENGKDLNRIVKTSRLVFLKDSPLSLTNARETNGNMLDIQVEL